MTGESIQVAHLWQRDRTTQSDFMGVGHFEAKF